jgi:hypothetical protein
MQASRPDMPIDSYDIANDMVGEPGNVRESACIAVVVERRALTSRWASSECVAAAVRPDVVASVVPDAVPGQVQWLFPGFTLTLYRDEAEGYFLNESNPQAFVWIKMAEQSSVAATDAAETPDKPEFAPVEATLSYHEASRWMDGGERVDAVLLPDDLRPWLAAYVAQHYRPEPKKKRIRPPSFKGARRDER